MSLIEGNLLRFKKSKKFVKLVFTSPMNQIDQRQGREGVAAAHDEVVLVRRVGAEHGAPAQLQRAPHRRRARRLC